jgi:hypothetical protein
MPTFDKMAGEIDPLTSKYTPQIVKILTLLYLIPSKPTTNIPAKLFKLLIGLIKTNK